MLKEEEEEEEAESQEEDDDDDDAFVQLDDACADVRPARLGCYPWAAATAASQRPPQLRRPPASSPSLREGAHRQCGWRRSRNVRNVECHLPSQASLGFIVLED